ncbi:MAG: TIGR03564 family F420-dependent LLM class oxidoreductase [Acidimicrobiales bacterium]
MRIGIMMDVDRPIDEILAQVQGFADDGFASAWAIQVFGHDALTLLAVVGNRVPGIGLGTAVVPIYARHPQVMAQQALTVQDASGGRLTLGIGLSHQMVVENLWGYSYDKPARQMREYLSALLPMLAGETVALDGEVVTAHTYAPLEIPGAPAPPVLVAALGPAMLGLAGRVAAGTVTWMTGTAAIGGHIVPTITAAAEKAGRPAPRVVVGLPVTVTDDVEHANERIDKAFALYPSLPSYKAMLDKAGASQPSDVSFVGNEARVAEQLDELARAGGTEFVAAVLGNPEEKERTKAVLLAATG